jgi:putative holliday junction resolvase
MATSQSVMGFDFGIKRIGVAVGDNIVGIAHAIDTIHAESNADRMSAVDALVREWQPTLLVIGEPAYENGSDPHPVAHLARKFGNRLKERHRLPVEYVNEFLSSQEASTNLAAQGIKGRAQKTQIDAAAAQVILQSYLDTTKNAQLLKARDAT